MRTDAYLWCLLALGLCGCATEHRNTADLLPPISGSQIAVNTRNNAYSLLYELLSEEKDVSKILLIKHEGKELNRFIKEVANTSADAAAQLKRFQEKDGSLDLAATLLPPGEAATRDAIAKTKTKALLGSSGFAFERAMLLTQIEALSYGSHLAKVSATHEADPARSEYLESLSQTLNRYYLEAIELLPADVRSR